jgi:hypothetical protein
MVQCKQKFTTFYYLNIFSYLTANELLFKVATLNKSKRQMIFTNRQNYILKDNAADRKLRIMVKELQDPESLQEYQISLAESIFVNFASSDLELLNFDI